MLIKIMFETIRIDFMNSKLNSLIINYLKLFKAVEE